MNPTTTESTTAARRAAILYWVMAGLALFFGLVLIATASAWPELSKQPGMQPLVDEFAKNPDVRPATLFRASGVIVGGYGAVLGVLGFFVWRSSRPALIVGLTVSAVAAFVVLLLTLASLIAGNPGGILMQAIALIAHAWLIRWQIAALRGSPTGPTFATPPAYVPMGAYYLPPMPPRTSSEAALVQ